MTIHVELTQLISKGDKITTIKDVFGNLLEEYVTPEDGTIIGKSVAPVNQSGGRIIHLGILK